MGNGYRIWELDEIEYLRNNWGKTETKLIAKKLNRPLQSIQRKAYRLKLFMGDNQYNNATGRTRWTPEMKDFLKKNYNKMTINNIMKELGIDNENKIRKQAGLLGISKKVHQWTKEDERYLRNYWGEKSIVALAKYFNTSHEAVRQKACEMELGNQLHASGYYYAISIICEMLGKKCRTVYGWIENGKLKCRTLKIGSTHRYQVEYKSLIEFLKNNQELYDTKNCNEEVLKTIVLDDNDEVPQWLIDKIEMDKVKKNNRHRKIEWTTKKEKFLRDSWGQKSIHDIAVQLNIPFNKVRQKGLTMGLGHQAKASTNHYTIQNIAQLLGISERTVRKWAEEGILENRKLIVGKTARYQVEKAVLIQFLKNNMHLYDTRKCDIQQIKKLIEIENQTIQWLVDKIDKDKTSERKTSRIAWTPQQENKLWNIYQEGKTLKEMAIIMGRSENSIDSKLCKMRKVLSNINNSHTQRAV